MEATMYWCYYEDCVQTATMCVKQTQYYIRLFTRDELTIEMHVNLN
jgi:hypothetical protein